ncbi:hypothetical protein M2322_003203 [Rhodoblastus acidophilus]|uniref:hypothetical protein n=1 Tax=Rhodoblastus acidophilus TaxID=1074 RepID=UPI002224232F|nr:hypothetical protein [Rhodoblastus acidophilus]MCW2317639.1 hypothetical protein [Rhodoblastus acidophilus]
MEKSTKNYDLDEAVPELLALFEEYHKENFRKNGNPYDFFDRLMADALSNPASESAKEMYSYLLEMEDIRLAFSDVLRALEVVADNQKKTAGIQSLATLTSKALLAIVRLDPESSTAKRYMRADISAGGKKGGQRSGEARRLKAEAAWQGEALQMALQIRRTRPDLSQQNLANEIWAGWKGETPPSTDSLLKYIRVLEQSGNLPKRQRK